MSFKKVTHVIFDLDGLLIESESVYNKIINDIAKPYGKEYTKEIKTKILGTTEQDTAKIAIKEMNLPLKLDEFLNIYHKMVAEQLTHPSLMPGVKELVQHLYKNNIPIAIATSSSQDAFDRKTKYLKDFFTVFHHVVCGTSDPDVKHGKPAPDIFLVCASRFPNKPTPEECLVFEDAPNGVKGAISAGMQAVMVPDPDIGDDLKQFATLVLGSLEEFKPEKFGLPAFN